MCLECEGKCIVLKCDICQTTKPQSAFPASAVKHYADSTQNSRCYDCSHPPCMFLPRCKTCAQCRRPTCRPTCHAAICTKRIETLPSEELPTSAEEVQNFACKRCKYVRCIVKQADGSRCGKERRHNAQAKARKNQEEYSCGECQTWLLSKTSLREANVPHKAARDD